MVSNVVLLPRFNSNHREHTILLSRERVNKGTKRTSSLPLSPVGHLFSLLDLGGKTAYKSCNTVALNSYTGLSVLNKKDLVCITFDKGDNSLPKQFGCTANVHSNI